ncbi:MAG: hypothetical protein P8Y70_14445 [Candidatus Lokiarchaeota archaeon]
MSPKKLPNLDDTIEIIRKDSNNKIGLVCLNCVLIRARVEEIQNFIEKHQIKIPADKNIFTKFEYLKHICFHFYKEFISNEELSEKYGNPLSYIGNVISQDENFKYYLTYLDFISKQDLIEVFADHSADLGTTVYSMDEEVTTQYHCDLYLVRRTPLLRTEAVFVRTGSEINKVHKYNSVIDMIERVSEIANWSVLVTTPMAIYSIGLKRIIKDMKYLDASLYVIDPARKKIFGIIKGKKSRDFDSYIRDQFLEKLPRVPLRAQSELNKISTYKFDEGDSFNPDDFERYALLEQTNHDKIMILPEEKPHYIEIFKNMMIIERSAGIPVFSYSSEDVKDQIMFSSFLSAMDDFVGKFGGDSSLQEINYKGFFVLADYSEDIKVALFLTKPADKELKERLSYFAYWFEENYKDEIQQFKRTGETSLFIDKEILPAVKHFLDI